MLPAWGCKVYRLGNHNAFVHAYFAVNYAECIRRDYGGDFGSLREFRQGVYRCYHLRRWTRPRHLELDHWVLRGCGNSTHRELYARTSRWDLDTCRTKCRHLPEKTLLKIYEESVIAP